MYDREIEVAKEMVPYFPTNGIQIIVIIYN